MVNALGLDGGSVSRVLRGFEKRGLLAKHPYEIDGRKRLLQLTGNGKKAFVTIDTRSRRQIEAALKGLSTAAQNRLVEAMTPSAGLLGITQFGILIALLNYPRNLSPQPGRR